MTNSRLIELYGRRFTPFARIIGVVAIIIFGILIAFKGANADHTNETNIKVEQTGFSIQ